MISFHFQYLLTPPERIRGDQWRGVLGKICLLTILFPLSVHIYSTIIKLQLDEDIQKLCFEQGIFCEKKTVHIGFIKLQYKS